MKLVVDIDLGTIGADEEVAEAVVKRRLLAGPRTDTNLSGFQCTVIGQAWDTSIPTAGGTSLLLVKLLEG